MSVAQMFEGFYGQLALAQTLRSSISTRTGRIVGRLNSDFRSLSSDTAHRFYAGSYGRNTAVPGLSDIDLNKLPRPKGRGIRRFASQLPEVAKSEDRRKRRGIYPQ